MDFIKGRPLHEQMKLTGHLLATVGFFVCSLGSVIRLFEDGLLAETPSLKNLGDENIDNIVMKSFRNDNDKFLYR